MSHLSERADRRVAAGHLPHLRPPERLPRRQARLSARARNVSALGPAAIRSRRPSALDSAYPPHVSGGPALAGPSAWGLLHPVPPSASAAGSSQPDLLPAVKAWGIADAAISQAVAKPAGVAAGIRGVTR
jgi:hypothetical protein